MHAYGTAEADSTRGKPGSDTKGAPPSTSPAHIVSTLCAVLLAGAVLLPLLGHRSLTDWDEGIYAEIAREMLRGGWRALLAPHWNGHLWFEKPPLQMWLTALSLRLFGLTAFAARLPSALAGVAIAGLLHGWMRRYLGTTSAWLGTCLLLSAFGFQHAARAGETDTLLSLGCLIAVMGLGEVRAGRSRGWWLFWTGFAAALMTKGAASVVLPLSAAVVLIAAPRELLRFGRSFALGFFLFLLLVLPWHLWMYAQFGQAFLREYLGFHVLSRTTGAIEGHRTHAWFYLRVLLVSAPPFALVYPWAIAAPFRRAELRPLRCFAVFALVVLLLFTAAQTRLPHYIAPAYPALSGLGGGLLGVWLRPWLREPRGRLWVALAGLALYASGAAITAGPRKALHSPHLANGFVEPDNRESAALLREAASRFGGIPGPLLVWRTGADVPITTDAFYGRRLAQQVSLEGVPPGALRDRYFFSPKPLAAALPPGADRLLLIDRELLPQLPRAYAFAPLATGPTLEIGVVGRSPSFQEPQRDRSIDPASRLR